MDIDLTIVAQFAILITLIAVLGQLVFKPFLRLIEARHAKLQGSDAEVQRLRAAAAIDEQRHAAAIAVVQAEAHVLHERLREQGRTEERRVITAARQEVGELLQRARAAVATAEKEVSQTLQQSTEAMAQSAVKKLLGHQVRP